MAVTFIIVIIVGRLNAPIDSTLITYQGTIGCVGGGLKAPEFQSRPGSPAYFPRSCSRGLNLQHNRNTGVAYSRGLLCRARSSAAQHPCQLDYTGGEYRGTQVRA